jgi:A/G-specific adenine glycosylase
VNATPPTDKANFSAALLDWYDRQARELPWRTSPAARRSGARPDPYRVWLSEIMLQQTTVATVRTRFERFVGRWPDVRALAAAPLDDVLGEWAGLGYYARARNLSACAKAVAFERGGEFPGTVDGLLTLPGIGPYSAAAIAAIAFDAPAAVVDGNVERVVVRQYAIGRPIKDAKAEIRSYAAELTPQSRPGDYAQAMMDLGATVCRPRSPQCLICPVARSCAARARGLTESIPVKAQRSVRPTRYGTVFVGLDGQGRILTERRPPSGLFGGMAGLPGSAWTDAPPPEATPPIPADWEGKGEVEHVLTHFRLKLQVMAARVNRAPEPYFWTAAKDRSVFPTAFRKAIAAAIG